MSRKKHLLIPELTERQLRNFWLKIDKRGPDDCWEWSGGKVRGYGNLRLRPLGTYLATRVMYYLATGKQPGPLCVCHKCDNPGCCNPAHFFLGTLTDNAVDMWTKGRGTAPRGVDQSLSKLTEEQVLEIRASNATPTTLAPKYGMTPSAISKIKLRHTWKHI